MQCPRLLVVTLCAASLVTPSGGFGNRRLCGIQLVEALLFVCGEKGLFYQPGRRVREENIRAVKKGHMASPEDAKQVVLKDHVSAFRMTKRGIVEQCCHFYCDYYDLENYCNI